MTSHVIGLQSKRLKQRTDKHMKEKYLSHYKKLKCFQDPVDNPENEGKQILAKGGSEQNITTTTTTTTIYLYSHTYKIITVDIIELVGSTACPK